MSNEKTIIPARWGESALRSRPGPPVDPSPICGERGEALSQCQASPSGPMRVALPPGAVGETQATVKPCVDLAIHGDGRIEVVEASYGGGGIDLDQIRKEIDIARLRDALLKAGRIDEDGLPVYPEAGS